MFRERSFLSPLWDVAGYYLKDTLFAFFFPFAVGYVLHVLIPPSWTGSAAIHRRWSTPIHHHLAAEK